MRAPSVHLNGTSQGRLLDAALEAVLQIENAREALKLVAPNGRDYYPQGDGALREAQEDYARMDKALANIERELRTLAAHIDKDRRGGL